MSQALAQIPALDRVARRLRREAGHGELPALWLFTDPERVRDPVAAASRLPAGSGVVFRAFGRPNAAAVGRALALVARRRGLVLLVGADLRLARRIGAAGVHLPERLVHRTRAYRSAWPGAIFTAAAHSAAALRRGERVGLDALFLSPVFASDSPTAGAPLGVRRFGRMAAASRLPVYALGGADMKTAPELLGSGAAGIAAVSALA